MSTENLPTKVAMGLSLLKAGGKALAYTAKHGELPRTPEEDAEARMAICKACPKITKRKGEDACSICKCILKYKVKLITEECPVGKW